MNFSSVVTKYCHMRMIIGAIVALIGGIVLFFVGIFANKFVKNTKTGSKKTKSNTLFRMLTFTLAVFLVGYAILAYTLRNSETMCALTTVGDVMNVPNWTNVF